MFSFFPEDDREQTLRIKRFLMAVASYFVWCSISVFTFVLELITGPVYILIGCLSGILVCNISIYTIIRTGFNKRFKDPSLTLFQMLIATFWAMVFLYYADSVRSAFLLLYLVVFVFGLFKLKVREFLFLSMFAVINYAAIILLLYKFNPESINLKIDLLYIVILATVLPWFSLIGGYITKLRTKISYAFSTIEQMTNNIQDVIFVMDMNLNYTYVSPSVRNLIGYEPEEVLKQAPLDAITPSSWDLCMRTLSEVMELERLEHKEGIYRTLQLEIRRKDGTTVWTETKFSFMRDKQKQPAGILGVMRDITERKRLEDKLQFEERRFRAFVEHSLDMIVIVNLEGRIAYVNPAIENVLGYKPEERIGAYGFEIVHPDDMKAFADIFNTLSTETNPSVIQGELRLRHKNGSWRTLEAVGSNQIHNNVVEGLIVNYRDITERKNAEDALRKSEARFREVLENTVDASYKRNLKTDSYDYLSPVFTKNYGYTMGEMMNMPLEALMDLVHPDDLAEAKRVIAESISGAVGTAYQIKYRIRRKEGPYRWCLDQFTIMRDADGMPSAVIGSVKDITEQNQMEEALRESEQKYRELSIIDDLTQLYNSRYFYVQLEREIERSSRYEQPLTLLMLDLDNFKTFNDPYGHIEGDHVLSRLGEVIKRCLRETDSAYRYGGEEFTIILPMTMSNEGIVTAERIQTELRKEVFSPVLGQEVYMTVSIGVTQFKPKEEIRLFVHRVDQLMYQAKRNGRNRICHAS